MRIPSLAVLSLLAAASVSAAPCDELVLAAEFGEVAKLPALVAGGADPSCWSDFYGRTPLGGAVYSERLESAKKLLELGANPNGVTHFGAGTPLSIAASKGYWEAFYLLLGAKGIDPSAKSPKGEAPIVDVFVGCGGSGKGPQEVGRAVDALLAAGADRYVKDSYGSNIAYRAAASCSDAKLAMRLRSLGLPLKGGPGTWDFPAFCSLAHESDDATIALLPLLDVMAADGEPLEASGTGKFRDAPLACAVSAANSPLVQWLLHKGADPLQRIPKQGLMGLIATETVLDAAERIAADPGSVWTSGTGRAASNLPRILAYVRIAAARRR